MYIIAEIGSNWRTFDDAKTSVSLAATAGASAVKFQLFDHKALYGFHGPKLAGEMPPEWIPKLAEKANACQIDFMCTAFSKDGVDFIDPYVKTHKIASSDITDTDFLKHVKSKRKPILLSVGGSSRGDVKQAVETLKGANLTLLYCNSSYPSVRHNLFQIEDLKKFGVPVGFSDHSKDVIYAPLSARFHFGCEIIEKHVNIAGHADTPDAPHSLNFAQFHSMCIALNSVSPLCEFAPTSDEADMFLRHNRRLIATREINIGEQFRFGENFGCYRSKVVDDHGLLASLWELVAKSTGAKVKLAPGQSIGPGDF